MNFMLFLLMLLEGCLMLVIFCVGIIAIYFAFNSSFLRNAPPVPSNKKIKKAMIESVAQTIKKKKHQVIMDLGSGWGSLLLPLAQQFPNHTFIGIEYGCIPYWVSKFRARKMKNIRFYHQNFFNTDISKADIIFLFLLSHLMKKVSIKCQAEAKKGTLLYVNRFLIPNITPEKEFFLGSRYDTYYIYKIHRNGKNKKKSED